MNAVIRSAVGATTFLVAALWLLPSSVYAQSSTTGAIAGVARDTTGAIVPGVTVEAASPALIEKVRVVVTDAQGNYKIVDLRPGTYTVTFTLTGFATYKREGIELTTGFTATANADMKVGSLEETVTVTGATPIVDTQNVRTQNVLKRDVLDSLPTAQTTQAFATLTLGASVTGSSGSGQDVGGNSMESNNSLAIHGGRGEDTKLKIDGMGFNSNHVEGGGIMTIYVHNQAAIQEVVLETGGISAESETGGIQLNAVPKDGGNTFKAAFSGAYTNEHFNSGAGLPADIIARGLTSAPSTKQVWDYQFGLGGPIKRDRLWFYTAHRWWGSQQYAPGAFYNKTPNTMFYTPDLSRPAVVDQPYQDSGIRLTWQATAKNKFTLGENRQHSCDCESGVVNLVSPEANGNWDQGPHFLTQVTWTCSATNRLLVESGASFGYFPINQYNDIQTPGGINITELSTGISYGSPATLTGAGGEGHLLGRDLQGLARGVSNNFNERFSVSYITGSHAFKAGLYAKEGQHDQPVWVPNELNYQFRGGAPVALIERVSPILSRERILNTGIFGQDQWRLKKLTLTLGVRFDGFVGSTLAEHIAPLRFVAPFDVQAVDDIPNWKNVTPRIGAAYDLFGNGKTAIKASLGKYMIGHAADIVDPNHPANSIVTSTSRTWGDTNGNFIPDCNLDIRVANGECGAIGNNTFGTSVVNTRYADDVLSGWGARDYAWQTAVVLQHELRPGLGLNVGYFHATYANFWARANQAVTPADFDPFCVSVPVDARLPGGGGNQVCGFYDVKPAKFGQVSNLVTQASNYGGSQSEVFNGVDVGFNARFLRSGLLQGGVSTGQRVTDACYAANLPNVSPSTVSAFSTQAFATQNSNFCRISPPWSAGTQVKLAGSYPLPWNTDVSFTFQNLPGAPIAASLVVTSAQVASSLGRDLSAGVNGTAVVQVLPSLVYFEDRITQLDLRFTKAIQIGRGRIRGILDIYNLLDSRAVLASNGRLGPSFLQPTAIVAPRLFKLGGQFDF